MKISIITLFPKMISGFLNESIVKRAIEKGLIEIDLINLRDFATDKYKSVDDKPYGGGAGMVLRVDILKKAVDSVRHSEQTRMTILTSAKGKVFNQQKAQEFSNFDHIIIIAGHYEGVDERVLDYIDEEISLGDFVVTGGEIAASAIVDSIVRLIPGVLKKEEASQIESFFRVSIDTLIDTVGPHDLLVRLKQKDVKEVMLLEFPQYTRPEEFEGKKVPNVLLSGNHVEIEKWRLQEAFKETIKKRPDLLR